MNSKVCYQNSVVADIMHLRFKKAYAKVDWLLYSQGGPGAPDPENARTGPVQVLGTVEVQILYSYFRLPVQVQVQYKYFRASSFKVYIFWEKTHYIMNCRVTTK